MMPRQDGRIEKGQSLRSAISARAWNRAQDAADIVLGATPDSVAGDRPFPHRRKLILPVKNVSGQDLPRLSVLRLLSPVVTAGNPPSSSLAEIYDGTLPNAPNFIENPVFNATTISGLNDPQDRLVILDEPLANNAIGRGIVGGVFVCVVDLVNTQHRYATGKTGSTMELRSTTCGPVQLLWVSGSTIGRRWALAVM